MDYRYLAIEGPRRRGQDGAGRAPRAAPRCHRHPRGRGQPVPRRLLCRTGRAPRSRRSCSSCSTATASSRRLRQAELFSQVSICDYLFDRDRIYAYLSLGRQRAVHLPAALRPARPGHPAARSRGLPAGPDRRSCCKRLARPRPRPGAAGAPHRPGLREGAERGVPALLLPLHGHAAARRGDVADRLRPERRCASTTCSGSCGRWAGTQYYVPRK
ncbi:MAG: hypothetical protein M0C28_13145 [Candidatus Moduliflexus flocculans]|nr:hypothetical protein [Candidatus Moduliflexus flocculans]